MKIALKIIAAIVLLLVLSVAAFYAYVRYLGPNAAPNWEVEKNAVPSATHPLAGFYKDEGCADSFGLAIGPANEKEYYISFCGPGGCFAAGTYRPNTTIYNDPKYEVITNDKIKIMGDGGWSTNVRCPSRSP
jgi:hypothetical protein